MKKILIVFLTLLCIPAKGLAEDHHRLVAIGDSIPFGYNLADSNHYPTPAAFPYLIGKEKGLGVTNLSIPGLTSRELLTAVKGNDIFRDSLRGADYVIVYIGGNDLLNVVKNNKGIKGITIEEISPVIRDLVFNVYATILEIDQLTEGQILVYNLYNPYPLVGEKLSVPLFFINQQYTALIKLLSHFTSVTLIDAHQAFEGHPEYILDGDVHPTAEGQQVLADLALEKIP